MRFEPYDVAAGQPNVVVDGSPNAATVLTLSHWPGLPAPAGLADDLSAQIAFRYLDRGADLHGSAEVVTNNHFDQDGLVGVFALCRPDEARARREVLVDLAAAGDFATYRFRAAARASMAVAALSHGDTGERFREVLPHVPDLVDRPDRFRELWADEDEALAASERDVASGLVRIEERPELDLAVVTLPEGAARRGGHRFGGHRFDGVHPMALHNATSCLRILLVHGRRYELTFRYESWVAYRTRRPQPRIDLAPAADELTAAETGPARWEADPVDALTPQLRAADSSLDPAAVLAVVEHHLRTGAPAWDPYGAER